MKSTSEALVKPLTKKTLLIVAHPSLYSGSKINKYLLDEIKQNQLVQENVTIHDLYNSYPDFQIDIKREQQLLLEHDKIVLQFPFFWYSATPLLKKWLDDVLTYGFAYGDDGDKLKGKKISLLITTGGNEVAYSSEEYNRFSVTDFFLPFEQTAFLCQMEYQAPFLVQGSNSITIEELNKKGQELVNYLTN